MIIRVDGLVRRFGALAALDGISLEVGRGELFGLIGPDGAGKTTALRILAGVLAPTSGAAWLNGISVAADPEGVKRSIAYMSQRFGLYTDLTVQENLEFYADLYNVPRAERARRVERLYGFSNLGPFRDRLAGNLSGGMKQKLGLSCALVHQPEILLLDEPTFGVDPISRRDLWLIVHEMVAEGVTAVVSTAYMDEAERFDRIALIHRGRLLALDRPDRLRQSLDGDLLSVRLTGAREARTAAEALPFVRMAAVFGDRLHLRVDSAGRDAPRVEQGLRAAGFEPLETAGVDPSMEDVFIEMVRGAGAS